MNKISVYVKGGQNSPNYYRINQYLNKIGGYDFKFRTMLSPEMHERTMPLCKQPIYIKVGCLIIMYFRILWFLCRDFISRPSAIIISRRVITRIMPLHFKWLLKTISRTSPIIWDFDDDIIDSREVSRKTFNFYADISSVIFCTHEHLAKFIPDEHQHKVYLLPTTDGDMYKLYLSISGEDQRINTLREKVKLVWVATSVNIPFISAVAPWLDEAASVIKEKSNRDVELFVVCNGRLDYAFKNLRLVNLKWTRELAIQKMLESHIGIMPLKNTVFAKGKGGFKLVQYLSVGLPCIGSKIGFNTSVISEEAGFLVETKGQWIEAIEVLSNPDLWEKYSKSAFAQWNKMFSFEANLNVWKETLNKLAKH